MATRQQTIDALTGPSAGWTFTPNSEVTLRRPLFLQDDNFVFSSVGESLTLRVLHGEGQNAVQVLGKDLLLGWDTVTSAFTVTAYGRHMEFRAMQQGNEENWFLNYQAMYEADPHSTPDEGGDGDPK